MGGIRLARGGAAVLVLVLVLALVAACDDSPSTGRDLGPPDLSVTMDLATTPPDQAAPPDLLTVDLVPPVDAAPAGDMTPPCAGTRIGGACWYKGAQGASCTTVCATHGGYDAATTTYAGAPTANDRTNLAHCMAIAAALSTKAFTTGVDNVQDPNDYGCVEEPDKNRTELVSLGATVAGGANALVARFCACVN